MIPVQTMLWYLALAATASPIRMSGVYKYQLCLGILLQSDPTPVRINLCQWAVCNGVSAPGGSIYADAIERSSKVLLQEVKCPRPCKLLTLLAALRNARRCMHKQHPLVSFRPRTFLEAMQNQTEILLAVLRSLV